MMYRNCYIASFIFKVHSELMQIFRFRNCNDGYNLCEKFTFIELIQRYQYISDVVYELL